MRQRENEYERAVALSTVTSTDSSSFNIIRRSNQNAETFFNANNIVISGCGSMKQNLLISLLAEHQSLPIIIITDEQRSRLAMTLQNTMSANFSFVRHNKESSCYNFLRHKSTPEMVQFFTQIANENGLFEQRRVESELLLRSILQLSTYSTNVFTAIANGRLTGEFLLSEINRHHQQAKLSDNERASLIASINSSISATQNVSVAFCDLFYIMNNMQGIPFSVKDIIDHKRRVCFSLDGNINMRNKCWYLSKMLSYDLNDYLNKSNEPFLLILDLSNKDKLTMFSEIVGAQRAKVIMNIDNSEYLSDNYSVSNFQELYIFSHPDLNSAKYWSEYFATHKVAEYTYSSNNNQTNKYPLLPLNIGSIFGEISKGTSTSYRMIDKYVFEINEIRELRDHEFIYYNHMDRKPIKYTLR
ncbi:MAG: hypothetical protein WAT94_02645 [Enterococcus aquimarinus]